MARGPWSSGIHTLLHILRITFSGPKFSLREAACARLSHEYANLGSFERECADLQFQEPRTKLWLFDTLVTPIVLYELEMWGLNLNKASSWKIDGDLSSQ